MRLIDGDELIHKICGDGHSYMTRVLTATKDELQTAMFNLSLVINNAPAIDAVPVVRCDHCRYCTEHYDTDGNVPYWTCSEWDSGTDADGYCYYGKRKDGINNAFN